MWGKIQYSVCSLLFKSVICSLYQPSECTVRGGGPTLTLNWRSCQWCNFRPQTSLEEYSEQSRSPKASKMDLQMIIGCFIFSKKSKMRFDCYLLYFRPFLTSKSDLKIVQKSFKNHPGVKHYNSHYFFCRFSSKNENLSKFVQKGSKNRWLQNLEFWTWGPPGSQIDPRLIPGGRNRSIRPFWSPKWLQHDLKMTSNWNHLNEKS